MFGFGKLFTFICVCSIVLALLFFKIGMQEFDEVLPLFLSRFNFVCCWLLLIKNYFLFSITFGDPLWRLLLVFLIGEETTCQLLFMSLLSLSSSMIRTVKIITQCSFFFLLFFCFTQYNFYFFLFFFIYFIQALNCEQSHYAY